MIRSFLTLLMISCLSMGYAQGISGKYAESAITAPDHIRDRMQNEVVIIQDAKNSQKIWVRNLIGNAKFYAVRTVANGAKEIYNIPPQTIDGYAVKLGCIVFDGDDDELVISLNNKANCFGMSQSDYADVSVGLDGVSVGDIKVGSKGEMATGSTKMGKRGVHVNAKEVLSGLQYVGTKM